MLYYQLKAYYLSNVIVNGDKQIIECRNFTKEDITKWLNLLTTQAGNSDNTRLRKLWHTDFPSIQGPWTPFTFKDPSLNLATFPNNKLSKPLDSPESAAEKLLEIFKEQQKLQELEKNRAQ